MRRAGSTNRTAIAALLSDWKVENQHTWRREIKYTENFHFLAIENYEFSLWLIGCRHQQLSGRFVFSRRLKNWEKSSWMWRILVNIIKISTSCHRNYHIAHDKKSEFKCVNLRYAKKDLTSDRNGNVYSRIKPSWHAVNTKIREIF